MVVTAEREERCLALPQARSPSHLRIESTIRECRDQLGTVGAFGQVSHAETTLNRSAPVIPSGPFTRQPEQNGIHLCRMVLVVTSGQEFVR